MSVENLINWSLNSKQLWVKVRKMDYLQIQKVNIKRPCSIQFSRTFDLFRKVKGTNTFSSSAGAAVKNLSAIHLLQASLLESQDSLLCCQLLRTLQTIWERDPANFFLLEWTVQTMAQLAACVWRKPAPVQKLFFSMLEMVRPLM